ncbi:MAG: tetratricopeptide repeat protein [Bdellovibrionota bacterium]
MGRLAPAAWGLGPPSLALPPPCRHTLGVRDISKSLAAFVLAGIILPLLSGCPGWFSGKGGRHQGEIRARLSELEDARRSDYAAMEEARKSEREKFEKRILELEEAIQKLRSEGAARAAREEALVAEVQQLRKSLENVKRAAEAIGADVQPTESDGVGAVEVSQARKLFEDGQYAQARELLSFALSQPVSPALAAQAYALLGESHFREKAWDQAALAFHRIVEEYAQFPEAPKALHLEATSLAMLGRTQDATFLFKKLLTEFPDSPEAAQVRAEMEGAEVMGEIPPTAAEEGVKVRHP